MNKVKLFATITKIDMANKIVSGLVTEEVTDKVGEKMDYATSAPLFKRWSTSFEKATGGKSKGNVRWMHQQVVAGKVLEMRCDDVAKQITVDTIPVDDETLRKIDEGFITGFSLGGNTVGKMWDDPEETGVKRYTVDPVEISYVDNPCLATATIIRIAPDGSSETRKARSTDWEPAPEAVVEVASTIAAEKGGSYSDHMAEAKAKVIAAEAMTKATEPDVDLEHIDPEGAGGEVTDPTAEDETGSEIDPATGKPVEGKAPGAEKVVDWNIHQVFQAPDGKIFTTKAEAKKHVEALQLLEANGSPLAAALEAAKGASKKPKGDYGDVKYADPGYQTDKKPRYPVDTPAHIRAAWSYINKPKNAALYSAEDLAKVKAAIIAAWKDKIDTAGPPSAEKMALLDNANAFELLKALTERRVAKGLYTVGWNAHLLAELGCLLQSVVWEEAMEHDTDSELPQLAMDAFSALRTLLVEMISEETAELIHDLTQGGQVVDIALLEPPCDAVIIELAARACDIVKADTALMTKVGARNSANDQKHIQAAHDSACKAGASCDPDNCPDTEKVAKGLLAENAKLKADIEGAIPEIAKLGATIAEITTKLEATNAELERVKALPAPMPQLGQGHRAVAKGEMQGMEKEMDGVSATLVVADLIKTLGPDKVRDMMLAASLSNPITVGR